MSLGGESKHSPKLSNLRPLDDDQLVRLVRTPRPSNGLGQHPAQDRLKRLQAHLKRMQDNGKEQGTTKRSPHSSLAARRSSASTSTPQRILKVPAKVARNAWEKPKALVDANRLKAGRSQPANQRLMLLRASLQQKQQCEERNNNIVPKINEEVIEKQPEICNITNTSAFGSTASDMEVEPMEWQDSIGEDATQKDQDEAKEGDDTQLMLQAESIEEEAPQKDQDETKKEDDTLLMLQAADAEELPPRLVDYMYFVLDTNVLIHDHKFVERLADVVLPGTVGSMLYLPYIVIKELDKLKYKSDFLKRLIAVRAIRFLNTKFDESLQIQAQSALEEADHLIKIDCPDDSIVNCCLQLQEQVPHMMLLTNDANLRLKANASNIKVSSLSALMSTYADEFAGFGD